MFEAIVALVLLLAYTSLLLFFNHCPAFMALREHRLLVLRKAFSRNASLERALRSRGFGTDRVDANELAELFELDTFCGKLCAQAVLLGTARPERAILEITAAMVDLQSVALRVEPITALSTAEREAERMYEATQLAPWPEAESIGVTRWQHITGRTFEALKAPSATMHEIPSGLVNRWANKKSYRYSGPSGNCSQYGLHCGSLRSPRYTSWTYLRARVGLH